MSAWIIFLIVLVPFLAILAWIGSTDSVINIPPGRVGLLLVRGRATDKVVEPGLHWVPRLRKRMVAEYPSLELSWRAVPDGDEGEPRELDRTGPGVQAVLGDRAEVTVGYTLRFRLDVGQLRSVHERFGAEGVWTAVRDLSARALRQLLADGDIGVDDLFGARRLALESRLNESIATALREDGVLVTMFGIDRIDLGRTGDVIQGTVRARLELEREQAETALRVARATIDAELEPLIAAVPDVALRYREVDLWRDLVHSQPDRVVPGLGRPLVTWTSSEAAEQPSPASDES